MSLASYIRKGKRTAAVGEYDKIITSAETGIVAHAGGGKASATALTKTLNVIGTCATEDDSVLLPAAEEGRFCVVFNDGAAAARLFGQGTDTIDGVATATGVPLTNAKRALFICVADGAWISAQLGVVAA